MSKGSRPRPLTVSHEKFSNNWDAIFGKNDYQDILSTEDCVLEVVLEALETSSLKDEYVDIDEDKPIGC